MVQRATVPRGRHAPPLEIRLSMQRRRLFTAAAEVFARVGYADATAEAIAREAGMSKATFYEHFANKEECILALFDEAATEVIRAMADSADAAGEDPWERWRAGTRAFLDMLAEHPAEAQTLLVEVGAAGERGADRRDKILALFARMLDEENAAAARQGVVIRFSSEHDAFALVGAGVELVSRQIRLGVPKDVRDLEPLFERLALGLLRVPSNGR
jgi:AcrR family transcriptional regulator